MIRRGLDAITQFDPFPDSETAAALAQAIVDTIREPLLVLDADLRVVTASRSFFTLFTTTREAVVGRFLYALDGGRWDLPGLRLLLEGVLPERAEFEAFEVESRFGEAGPRRLLMNARTVHFPGNANAGLMILLAMEDVTDRHAAETAMRELLREKEVLLLEMQHRVANSLQIIASILLLKARGVQSEETRLHLREAHQRVLAVAAVQQQLGASRFGEPIELGPYLTRLCETLADAMITSSRPIALEVRAIDGRAPSGEAVSIGLLVTELVINAMKHAFPLGTADSRILVAYEVDGADWTLSVEDNGGGYAPLGDGAARTGLGTSIVDALANRLGATVAVDTGPAGTRVAIRHASVERVPSVA